MELLEAYHVRWLLPYSPRQKAKAFKLSWVFGEKIYIFRATREDSATALSHMLILILQA